MNNYSTFVKSRVKSSLAERNFILNFVTWNWPQNFFLKNWPQNSKSKDSCSSKTWDLTILTIAGTENYLIFFFCFQLQNRKHHFAAADLEECDENVRLRKSEKQKGQEGREASVDHRRPDGDQGRLSSFKLGSWNNKDGNCKLLLGILIQNQKKRDTTTSQRTSALYSCTQNNT